MCNSQRQAPHLLPARGRGTGWRASRDLLISLPSPIQHAPKNPTKHSLPIDHRDDLVAGYTILQDSFTARVVPVDNFIVVE